MTVAEDDEAGWEAPTASRSTLNSAGIGVALAGAAWFIYVAVVDALHGAWLASSAGLAVAAGGGALAWRRRRISILQHAFDTSVAPSADGSMSLEAGSAIVVVRRRPTTFGSAVRCRVWIDGVVVGLVGLGETKLFQVTPGDHRVAVGGRHYPLPAANRQWGVSLAAGEIGDFVCTVRPRSIELRPTERL